MIIISMSAACTSIFVRIKQNNKLSATLLFVALAIVGQQVVGPISIAQALRTGAPAMACMNLRPMHGLNRPRPASSSQFFIRQSSLAYAPGDLIDVEILTYSQTRHFRGFIIQAYDPLTGHHIGHFAPTKESRPVDACSAATHRDNTEKQHVKLVWLSPGASLPSGTDLGAPASGWRSPIQPSINFSILHKRQALVSVNTNVTHLETHHPPPAAPQDNQQASPTTQTPSVSDKPSTNSDNNANDNFNQFNQNSQTASGTLARASENAFQPMAAAAAAATPAQSAANNPNKKSVRFKATIVVAYDEFYMGFESSDLSYDAFSFANGSSTV